MPKFVFKLGGVLTLRIRSEQQAQHALAERKAEVARISDELRHLNGDLQEASEELRVNHLTGSLDISYLAAHRRFTADVARRGSDLMSKIALAERGAREAQTRLAEAAKQRKILEILRDKHLARWRSEEMRRETIEADDATGRWFDMIQRDRLADDAQAEHVAHRGLELEPESESP